MLHDTPPPCESSPTHPPAAGRFRIGTSDPMDLCNRCMRHAVAVWLEDAADTSPEIRPVTFQVEPIAA